MGVGSPQVSDLLADPVPDFFAFESSSNRIVLRGSHHIQLIALIGE
jgi:hypothetical protein